MKRSNAQNEYYWGVLIKHVTEYYQGNEIQLVRDLINYIEKQTKSQFAPNKDFIHEIFKLIFNNSQSTCFKDVTLPTGQVITGTMQMNDYWERIRDFYYHEKKLLIPLPNEIPIEAYELPDYNTKSESDKIAK